MDHLPEYVVFDLETNADRPVPTEHEIIQIGGVKVSASGEQATFESLVRPQRKLPERITKLTGLEYGDLGKAPPLDEKLPVFLEWVGDLPLIAHNGFGYDFVVLDAAASSLGFTPPEGPRLDTLELAHLIFPRAGASTRGIDGTFSPPGRSLDQLAEIYGLQARDRHDALLDAQMTREIMLNLLRVLNDSTPARRLQRRILDIADHPWSKFTQPTSAAPALQEVIPTPLVTPRHPPSGTFDLARVTGYFEPGGKLMSGGREPRAQQVRMARLVSNALSRKGSRWMIEAPTGTGKTLAYLVPAIEMARASGRTTLVTPHSRVLQDQIMATLEELEAEMGPIPRVVLKGRHNYISLRSLDSELTALEEESDGGPAHHTVAMALAIISGWVAQTPTGDWADLRTAAVSDSGALGFFRWKLRVERCPGPETDRLDRLDFYRRARDALETAHVAVLNHALLATGPDLDPGSFDLVVDEAHDLEDSATTAATRETSGEQLERLCDAIWEPSTRRGLAARLARATGLGLQSHKIDAIRSASDTVRMAIVELSEPLTDYLRDRTGATREQATRYGASYRIRRGVDTRHPKYRTVLEAGRNLRRALRKVVEALESITVPTELAGRYRQEDLEEEVARSGREAFDAGQLIDSVLWATTGQQSLDGFEDADTADWINIAEVSFDKARTDQAAAQQTRMTEQREPQGAWKWTVRRAPLSVAGLLADLWEKSNSVVLTSATLRSANDFGYLIERLGLDRVESEVIGSPFPNLPENHLLLLTDYLPAPRGGLMDRFTETEAGEIPRLCVASDGGALVLMTARARLDYVRDHARPHLDNVGVELLSQGDESSPALIERMRAEPDSCLLGLRSFWEGIDVPGRALRLLVIEKIPFDPIGDPVVGARTELLEIQGRDPFADYIVPRAAIAFAQGVGRLIRAADDRGLTIVLDNRLRRPIRYRDVLLDSLSGPPTRIEIATSKEAYQTIADHLGLPFDEKRRRRIDAIPGVQTISQAALGSDTEGSVEDRPIERRLEIALEWLGFDRWRTGQHEVMSRFMRGEDVMAVLPTGSGKSVTYQVPALVSPGVTLVVSPLIALMRDQVDNLRSRGVSEAAAIYSGVSQAEQESILRAAAMGRIKLLYVSPERLWSPIFRSWLAAVDVARVAVDEAHCISMWGHSFRPEYSIIPRAIREVSGERLPILAVTATATPEVRNDIVELLGLQMSSDALVGSANRPEIRYYVERCANHQDRDLRVAQILEAFRRQSAIVYVPTRKDTSRLSALLRTFGHRARPYNGGMDYFERQHTEDAFRHGEIDLVVATKAFGLGIDKPDIAVIVHLEMPASVEEYVQETGRVARGSRDGSGPETGTAVLLVTPRDCYIHGYFVRSSVPCLKDVENEWERLRVGMNYIDPETRRRAGSDGTESDERGNLALHYLDHAGAIRRHPDFVLQGRVATVTDTPRRIDMLRMDDPDLARQAELLLGSGLEQRDYEGLRESDRLGMSPREVEQILFRLQKRDICNFTGWRYGLTFERPRNGKPDWDRLARRIAEHRRSVESRAAQARKLAHSSPSCRRREMLSYLGESGAVAITCGGCDACTPDLPRPWAEVDIRAQDVQEAAQETAQPLVLMLVDDVEGGKFSRWSVIRTLRGESYGPHPLNERLKLHNCFGRLAMLRAGQVEEVIDDLIDSGHIEEVEAQMEGRTWTTLRLTTKGRDRQRLGYGR